MPARTRTEFRPRREERSEFVLEGLEIRQFGDPANGDVPAPVDYDGTGLMKLAVCRSSKAQWLIESPIGLKVVQLGEPANGAVPLEVRYQTKVELDGRSSQTTSAIHVLSLAVPGKAGDLALAPPRSRSRSQSSSTGPRPRRPTIRPPG